MLVPVWRTTAVKAEKLPWTNRQMKGTRWELGMVVYTCNPSYWEPDV
jgi:hypothetical protein